ncbi:MAG: RNA-dependent DNA polymerase, partial [Candidatus Margulisbacteria bacterium]|nr:RNA-dependent DNA polymerase [Candidatus Margulisiibacteriota bacterium]
EIQNYLAGLSLVLHANKSQIYQTHKGVAFLGYKTYSSHRLVLKANVKRFKGRMKKYLRLLRNGQIARKKICSSVRSWFDYAMYADTFNLRKKLIADLVF